MTPPYKMKILTQDRQPQTPLRCKNIDFASFCSSNRQGAWCKMSGDYVPLVDSVYVEGDVLGSLPEVYTSLSHLSGGKVTARPGRCAE